MNAEALLRHYGRIADAPDAVERLRQFVLKLAVRGKLLPQDQTDESAAALLKKIAVEKIRLITTGEMRKPRDLDVGEEIGAPFPIPASWIWTRLDSIGAIVGGGTPSASDADNFAEPGAGTPWLTPADLGGYNSLLISRGARDLTRKGLLSSSATVMPTGSVLFTSRAPIGYVAIAANPISTNQGFKSIVPYIAGCSRFIATVMKTFAPEIDAKAPGTTFKEVSGKIVAAVPFPLPPLAEQHRIVAKVDELMALCDQLEAARAEREATRDRLAAASLARLNTPDPDPETFKAHASFAISTALPALTTRPDQIKQLRQTILNLAVRGKLVDQDESDEPAVEILNQVGKEKRRLGIKPSQISDNLAVTLPVGWVNTTLGAYAIDVFTGPFGSALHQHEYIEGGIPLINPSHMKGDRIVPDPRVSVSPTTADRLSSYRLETGDIVMARRGEVGRAARVEAHQQGWLCGTGSFFLRFTPEVDRTYLLLLFRTSELRAFLAGEAVGTTMVNLNHGILKRAPLRVPPLAEQNRIVIKVNELMKLCDQLEASLESGADTRRCLLDALLHEALLPMNGKVIDFAAARQRLQQQRESIACRVVQRLGPTRGFGRVRAMKPLYWAEAHCGAALGGQWGRAEAGPFDQWIFNFEAHAASAGWFSVTEYRNGDKVTKAEYRAGTGLSAKAAGAAEALGSEAPEFERVLSLLADLNTEDSEIVTTLYAAWNDLLLEGKPFSDAAVITEVREHWHPSKARFTPALLQTWLDWLRKNRLVPKGKGPNTRHQPELI